MSDLVAFLQARLIEDEAAAQAATPGGWRWVPDQMWGDPHPVDGRPERVIIIGKGGYITGDDAEHIARWDPARVLAEVAAKRRIVDRCIPVAEMDGWEYADAPDLAEAILDALAQPYVDHPDFDPAWRTA